MPVLYTKRRIHEVLKELGLRDIQGRVDAKEAARILSWRAMHEQGIAHTYTPTTVRKHRDKLDPTHPLKDDGTPNTRTNLYLVEKLFDLDIEPKRTNSGRWSKNNEVLTR